MSTATTNLRVSEMPQPHWLSRSAFLVLLPSLLATQFALFAALSHGWIWLAVPLVLVASHFMHGMTIGFHEASHGLLRRNRRLNDFDGLLIGIFSFMSFTLYRAAHQTHHMHLATERDEELWPFVRPEMPRWARVLAAVCELSAGIVFTPLLFLRIFLRRDSPIRSKKVRRRVWAELTLIAIVWTALLLAVNRWHAWTLFLWMFAVPGWLASNLQSWRKYIEHVGMTGSTPNSATRSIVTPTWLGRFFSFTLLHEPYHGVHHEIAGIGHAELPLHASALEPREPGDVPPFPSYRHALLHLLRSLADPRVGPQWRAARS